MDSLSVSLQELEIDERDVVMPDVQDCSELRFSSVEFHSCTKVVCPTHHFVNSM